MSSLEELSPLELDEIFIEKFGEPYRDEEMLLWDNLRFNKETKKLEKIEDTN